MEQSRATLTAAVLAACLSAVTLAVTVAMEFMRLRQAKDQETVKWVRATLHQAALDFIRTAFAFSGLSREARRMRLRGAPIEETQPLLDQAHEAHTLMQDLLSSIRLLASTRLIQTALDVHDKHHALVNNAFGQLRPSDDDPEWTRLHAEARNALLRFADQAREPLGLDAASVISTTDAWSSWTVPADVWTPDIKTRWLPSRPS